MNAETEPPQPSAEPLPPGLALMEEVSNVVKRHAKNGVDPITCLGVLDAVRSSIYLSAFGDEFIKQWIAARKQEQDKP